MSSKQRSVRPSAGPVGATPDPSVHPSQPPPSALSVPLQQFHFVHHCHSVVVNPGIAAAADGQHEEQQQQPLYLEGINHCPACNPKHVLDAPRCHHDLRLSRVSGRPLRRCDGETIEDYTWRVNDVFKVCPLEREWAVATTNYFKMDFLHAWLEGLRSKYMTSIVLSMDSSSSSSSDGSQQQLLTVEKAVSSLRHIARQEDLIRQMETRRGGRVTPPHILDPFVVGDVGPADRPSSRWIGAAGMPGAFGGKGPRTIEQSMRMRGRVNENSQFVRIVKVNPEDHDEDDLDADGSKIWI